MVKIDKIFRGSVPRKVVRAAVAAVFDADAVLAARARAEKREKRSKTSLSK